MDRAVPSDTRDLPFESSHRQILSKRRKKRKKKPGMSQSVFEKVKWTPRLKVFVILVDSGFEYRKLEYCAKFFVSRFESIIQLRYRCQFINTLMVNFMSRQAGLLYDWYKGNPVRAFYQVHPRLLLSVGTYLLKSTKFRRKTNQTNLPLACYGVC